MTYFVLKKILFKIVQLSTLFCTKILKHDTTLQQKFSYNSYNIAILL